ncbi:MAG: hypothetical protein AB8F74_05060, partial [Saprospiraceae bacterium]
MKKERPLNLRNRMRCINSKVRCFVLLLLLTGIGGLQEVQAQAPTSSCADPIEVSANFCPVGIGPGTPNGAFGIIPATGIVTLQVGALFNVDLNCLMDDVDAVGGLELSLSSSQFIGTPTDCIRVIEGVFDIRDSDGNIA